MGFVALSRFVLEEIGRCVTPSRVDQVMLPTAPDLLIMLITRVFAGTRQFTISSPIKVLESDLPRLSRYETSI